MKGAYSIILAIAGIATVTTPTHVTEWRSHGWGNYTDKVLDLAWDPSDSSGQSWYTAAPGGLYHTNDLAESFRLTGDDGLDNLILSGVAVARDAPHILYVTTGYAGHPRNGSSLRMPGNGVYRSSDHGATWTRVAPQLVEDDLHYLTSVVTSALGDTVLASSPRRIMRSLDSGETWEEVLVLDPALDSHSGPADDPVIDLLTHERNLQTVIAVQRDRPGTYAGEFYRIMASYDGGAAWDTLRVLDRPAMIAPRARWNFAFPPTADTVIWGQHSLGYGTPVHIYRSGDRGHSWVDIPMVDPKGEGRRAGMLAAHPLHRDTLIGYGEKALSVYRSGKLEVINDGGGGVSADFLKIVPGLGTHYGFRIVQSFYRGQIVSWATSDRTWRSWPQGPDGTEPGAFNNAQVRDVCKLPTTSAGGQFRYLAAGHHLGIMVASSSPKAREDGWTQAAALRSVTQVVCHPDSRINHGLAIVLGQLYRTDGRGPNQRASWQKGGQVYGVDVVAAYPDRVFVNHGRAVLRSDDFGVTWDTLAQNITDPFGRRLSPDFVHVSRADPSLIYAGDILSRNGGDTWEQTQWPGLETDYSIRIGGERRYIERWLEVKSHPSDPSVIWTCTPLDIRRWDDELARSRVLATREDIGRCHDLLVMPTDTTWLWAGTQTGLWESTDGGSTWVRNANGLPPAVPVTTFDVRDDLIIVGTYGRGIFSLPQSDVAAIRTRREIARHSVPEDGAFLVTANWPNPFNDATTISFEAHKAAHIRMEVYDATGRRMAVLTDRSYAPGLHTVRWNAKGYGSGVYFARMMANGRYVDNRHLVLRK